ncbi:sugar ABC transporter permease [Vallitalea longa]|uniref:Sugar ABC transporter permease n=1 Tax=Vallitalea longa TaxID=2936439 RepID=A0A9W6DF81_9FIRM|nr:carbohydrate ABC transporter permease [Vallitalea longa]GKX28414.1 sugar ABC transporter permease [Vallitalea longa]
MNIGKKYKKNIIYVVLTLFAIIQIAPLIIVLLNSFRTNTQIKKFPVGIPTQLNLDNFLKAWKIGGYARAFLNSIIISGITTLIVVVISILVGYFLAKSTMRLKNTFLVYFGVSLSIPVFAYLVPLYYSFSKLDLVNTHLGIILIFIAINLPFNILLARTFVLGLPNALSEAAVIDGCNVFDIIWKIIFPLARPVVTTIILIVFVATWNEFTMANTFLQDALIKTAATKYIIFVGDRGSDLSMVYTAGIITMLPIVVIFIALQNYFIEGLTSGSIK